MPREQLVGGVPFWLLAGSCAYEFPDERAGRTLRPTEKFMALFISHEFLWTKQTDIQDLGTLPGDVNSSASNINDFIGGATAPPS